MNSRVFLYGTLRESCPNSKFHLLAGSAGLIGCARMQGRLFDLGRYPGFVPCTEDECYVRGEVYELINPAETLALLDNYEGVGPRQANPEYERHEQTAILDSGDAIQVWVYVYVQSTHNKLEIEFGDYVEYLKSEK